MALQSLERARTIERPTREAQLQRAPSVQHFWDQNTRLFEAAWAEWETDTDRASVLDESLYVMPNCAPQLRKHGPIRRKKAR